MLKGNLDKGAKEHDSRRGDSTPDRTRRQKVPLHNGSDPVSPSLKVHKPHLLQDALKTSIREGDARGAREVVWRGTSSNCAALRSSSCHIGGKTTNKILRNSLRMEFGELSPRYSTLSLLE